MLKLNQHRTANGEDAPLRVVNGISTQDYSMITLAELKASLAIQETLLFEGGVFSWLILNKSLRISPLLALREHPFVT